MYINLKNLLKNPNPSNLVLFLILKHAGKKDVSKKIESLGLSEKNIVDLEEKGFIKFIKGSKNQSFFQKMRLGKKGDLYLNSLSDPEIEEGDIKMFDYLCQMYLDHEDEERHIGNKKKTLIYCTEFRQRLDLSLHQMYWLCWYFIQEYTHTKKLEYIFFNSNKNRYGTFRNNFEDSPLYQFYDNRKKYVLNLWEEKIN